ncbi:MAG TPA: phage holin family protein, partial [Fimbriimonas sp.]|nr:phage holin family protein [Fimbriimonas sp.]
VMHMDYVQLVKTQWPFSAPWFIVLCIAMFCDFAMGVMCAVKEKTLNSSVARDGMMRKVGMLLVVGFCISLAPFVPPISFSIAGIDWKMPLAAIASSGFLFGEGVSILENAGKLGIQTAFLSKYLEKLRIDDSEPKDPDLPTSRRKRKQP